MSQNPPPLTRKLLLPLYLIGLGFCVDLSQALKVPFSVKDVLPVLPRQVSWLVFNSFHNAVNLLLVFIGSAIPSKTSLEWKGGCFHGNEARLEITGSNRDDLGLGGGVLHLKTSKAHSLTRMDLYVFATPYRITWDYYFSAQDHTLNFDSWEETAVLEYVKQHGVSVFLMPSGMLGTLLSLVDVLPLFSNAAWGQNANLAFLTKHMGATFEKWPQPWRSTINPKDVHYGDFFKVSKIRDRWSAFETLDWGFCWSYCCLFDLTSKDNSNPQIALLHPGIRAKFNNTAASEYTYRMLGKSYGYHNMIFTWIGTLADNYPPPLVAHLVISVMSMWTRVQPAYAANLWNEALNQRLGTW